MKLSRSAKVWGLIAAAGVFVCGMILLIWLVSDGSDDAAEARARLAALEFASAADAPSGAALELVGTWRCERNFFSTNGNYSSVTVRTVVLRPDGTALFKVESSNRLNDTDSGGHDTGSISADTGGGWKPCRWSASGNQVRMHWQNGTSTLFTYVIDGRRGQREMGLTPAGGKMELWEEVR